jgi:hypothetical protein
VIQKWREKYLEESYKKWHSLVIFLHQILEFAQRENRQRLLEMA